MEEITATETYIKSRDVIGRTVFPNKIISRLCLSHYTVSFIVKMLIFPKQCNNDN
jgi:hypothetical protein